jgi:membrane protein DedA with SNARE-associated domain
MQHYLATYGYFALFPLAVVEGPAVSVFAAFLASRGVLELGPVYAVVVLADLVGDLLYYVAGRWLLGWLRARQAPWAHRLRGRVEALAPRIRTRAGSMLLFGKLTHSAGFAVLLAAGAARVRIAPFVAYNLAGSIVKCALLVAAGYWFGRIYGGLQGELQAASLVAFVLVGGGLLLLAGRLSGGHARPEG